MADQDDLNGRDKLLRYLFIKLILLGDALAAIMRLLAMDQVMMEMKGIIGPARLLVPHVDNCVMKYTSGVMVDDDYSPSGGRNRGQRVGELRFLEEFAEVRNLFHFQIVPVRPPERALLRTDHEGELLVAVRYDLAEFCDQTDDFVPAEVAGELPVKQAVEKQCVVMAKMWAHMLRVALGDADCWSNLLFRSSSVF